MFVCNSNMPAQKYSLSHESEMYHSDAYYPSNNNYVQYTQLYPADSQNNLGHHIVQDETYIDSAYSTNDSPSHYGQNFSPINSQHGASCSPSYYSTHYCTPEEFEKNNYFKEEGYQTQSRTITKSDGTTVVKVVKKRNTANKKERRRTQSINSAYLSLRERIPNVPDDTKLSKIKTLRLAHTYIVYLVDVLQGNQDPSVDFRPELVPSSRKINAEKRAMMKNEIQSFSMQQERKKGKGRTGWPHNVWSEGLKQTGVKKKYCIIYNLSLLNRSKY
uniref:CSON002399 protein n=2 Tax=Culicoides sonorensis TaxID=179676 RepID=A0A336LMQ8_CULSO